MGAHRRRCPVPRAIGLIVARRLGECDLDPLTTHDPRRTLVSNLLDGGTDLVTVSEIVGHSSPATTAGYDQRPRRKHRTAIDRLPIAHDVQGARPVPPAVLAPPPPR